MKVTGWLWGPYLHLGFGLSLFVILVDQIHKFWMLYVYDIGAKGVVSLTTFSTSYWSGNRDFYL